MKLSGRIVGPIIWGSGIIGHNRSPNNGVSEANGVIGVDIVAYYPGTGENSGDCTGDCTGGGENISRELGDGGDISGDISRDGGGSCGDIPVTIG